MTCPSSIPTVAVRGSNDFEFELHIEWARLVFQFAIQFASLTVNRRWPSSRSSPMTMRFAAGSILTTYCGRPVRQALPLTHCELWMPHAYHDTRLRRSRLVQVLSRRFLRTAPQTRHTSSPARSRFPETPLCQKWAVLLSGNFANFRLRQFAQGEYCLRQLFLCESEEEVRLVLLTVLATQ